jgi:hypothetical protein
MDFLFYNINTNQQTEGLKNELLFPNQRVGWATKPNMFFGDE